MLRDTKFFQNHKGINIFTQTEAVKIEREVKKVYVRNVVTALGIRGYEAACLIQGKGNRQVAFLQGGLSVGSAYF